MDCAAWFACGGTLVGVVLGGFIAARVARGQMVASYRTAVADRLYDAFLRFADVFDEASLSQADARVLMRLHRSALLLELAGTTPATAAVAKNLAVLVQQRVEFLDAASHVDAPEEEKLGRLENWTHAVESQFDELAKFVDAEMQELAGEYLAQRSGVGGVKLESAPFVSRDAP